MSSYEEMFHSTTAEMYAIIGVLTVFSVFGSAGNAFVLYVFATSKDDLVSTLFIIVLAVVDFTTCLVTIPFTIVAEFVSYNVRLDLLCRLYQFLITSNIPFSALVMTAIAVDRYLCICHPFARLLTLRRARVVVVALAAFAAVFGVLGALTHSVYQRAGVVARRAARGGGGGVTPAGWANRSADEAVYTGHCEPTDLDLSRPFAVAFQRCYTATFVVCFGVVSVLYSLIYRSVLRQRRKRQQMKAPPIRSHAPIVQQQQPSVLETTVFAGAPAVRGSAGSEAPAAAQRDSEREGGICLEASPEAIEIVSRGPAAAVDVRDAGEKRATEAPMTSTPAAAAASSAAAETALRDRIANVKTAAMLFVVTLVFVVSFFPSLAMTLHIVPYSMSIFYAYFANNVANPVIYSFMNTNFRKRLARVGRRS